MSDHVGTYLRELIARAPDAPLLRELDPSELGTPRGTASIARAALAWLEDGSPEAVAARLRADIDEADVFARFRVSEASRDVCEAWLELPEDARPGRRPSFAELRRRRGELLGVGA